MNKPNQQNEGGFSSILIALLFFSIKAAAIVFTCGYAGMLLAEKLLNH